MEARPEEVASDNIRQHFSYSEILQTANYLKTLRHISFHSNKDSHILITPVRHNLLHLKA